MPSYWYEGKNEREETVRGICAAFDDRALYETLKKEGIFLTCFGKGYSAEKQKDRLALPILSEFCRQFGIMAEAGVSASRAVEILREGATEKRLHDVCKALHAQINQGCSISDAMENLSIFPDLMVQMFRAAESSGQAGETAMRLARIYQKEYQMQNQIRMVLFYPVFLLIMMCVMLMVLFLQVLPTIEPWLTETELPMFTNSLLEVSRQMKTPMFGYVVFFLMVSLAGIVLLCQNNVLFQCWWDRFHLHLPIIGRLFKTIYTARFARSQSSLYQSGISIVESLDIAGKTIGNRYLEIQTKDVIQRILTGEQFSQAIKKVDGFEKKLAQMIHVGEETGRLDAMLAGLAENYEYEAEVALKRLVSYLEPVLILFMGVLIGAVLLGILMPLWNMYGAI